MKEREKKGVIISSCHETWDFRERMKEEKFYLFICLFFKDSIYLSGGRERERENVQAGAGVERGRERSRLTTGQAA